jgi:hypothetical protein
MPRSDATDEHRGAAISGELAGAAAARAWPQGAADTNGPASGASSGRLAGGGGRARTAGRRAVAVKVIYNDQEFWGKRRYRSAQEANRAKMALVMALMRT